MTILHLTRASFLADIVGGRADQATRLPAADVLSGFDAAAQFSRRMLEAAISSSLAQQKLSPLAASAPWGALAMPGRLLESLGSIHNIAVRESRLELSLGQPQIVALNWPADADVSGSDPVSIARRTETHATRRAVTVAWRLELSVLTARFDQAVETLSSASGSSASGGFRNMVANVDLGLAPSADVGSSDDGKSWARSVFATGRVVLEADARLVSEPHLWRFGMDLDFGAATPAVTSDDTALLEFLAAAGQDLLARAIALLREADVRLTPRVAPAGTLSAKSVQRFGLPGFAVHDRLLVGRDGNPVLCLALQRDGASGGVMRLLKPFLEISDFGYAVSTSILEPALKARWKLYVGGASFAGESSFEAPLEEGGSDTETLRAQMTVRLGDVLDSVSLRASAGDKGDGLLLIGRQTIQLLNIWRENNDRVEDLGEFGRPADMPMAMLFYLFDRGNAADARQDLRELLMKLLFVLPYPLLQRSAVNSASLSGFASSPLKTVLMRWRLKTVFDDVATDTHGPAVLGRL